MKSTDSQPYRQQLRDLMKRAGIPSLEALSQRSQVSTWHLYRIQSGLMSKVSLEHAVKVANTLQISIDELLTQFCPNDLYLTHSQATKANPTQEIRQLAGADSAEIKSVKQEYHRLEQQLAEQRAVLTAEFQQASLETIESWLLQWPTAAAVAEKNPQLSAVKLLTLVKPINDLLRRWGVEAIGLVGKTIAYDPQIHQLMEGDAVAGDPVWVRYVGYQQGDKLLYRAKVSPIPPELPESPSESAKKSISVGINPVDQASVESTERNTTESIAETNGQTFAIAKETQSTNESVNELISHPENGVEIAAIRGEGEYFDDQFLDDYPEAQVAEVYYYD